MQINSVFFVDLSRKMAFTALVSSGSSSWSSETFYFVVITNLAHGYNSNDGVFTASTAGVYLSTYSYNSLSVYVDIVVNGARKVRTTMLSNRSTPP